MDTVGRVDKSVFSVESKGISSLLPTNCLCFEHILNLILNGETPNARATNLVLDETKEDLPKVESKLKGDGPFENIQTFINGVQVLNINMGNSSQQNVYVEHKVPVEDLKAYHLPIHDDSKGLHSRKDIHNYASLNNNQMVLLKYGMNNIEVLEDVMPRQKENNTTNNSHPVLLNTENLSNKIPTFYPQPLSQDQKVVGRMWIKENGLFGFLDKANTDLKYNIANIDLEQRGLSVNSPQDYLRNKETLEFGNYGSQQVLVNTQPTKWVSIEFDRYDLKLTKVDDTSNKLTENNLSENLYQNNDQNMDNLTHRALDPEKLNNNILKNSDFQIKTEDWIERSVEKNRSDISHSEKSREKITEYPDIYSSEPSNLKFGDELKATQEVRNSKQYGVQEHKIFHVKIEDGDIRIRFVRDSLNISLNLKEDIRLPSVHDSYRLIENLSQMGLRVEFFGINGKNLQWEFRQGQDGKREVRFKDVALNSKDEEKTFSLYL